MQHALASSASPLGGAGTVEGSKAATARAASLAVASSPAAVSLAWIVGGFLKINEPSIFQ